MLEPQFRSEGNRPMSIPQALIEKIEALPPERWGEVEDFIDFISSKARRLAALDRLLAIAPAIEATDVPLLTETEIQAEVDAMRAARRQRRSGSPEV
jgi:hypothetical protein